MGKLRLVTLVIAALILAVSPLVWAATIAPPAQPIHTHDHQGKETTVFTKTMSVPVAEATFGTPVTEGENLNTHVLLRVQVRQLGDDVHAECWALDNGGVHHSHWIYACQLHSNYGDQWNGTCKTPGGYRGCGYTTEDQHWHGPVVGGIGNVCFRAVGGFAVSTHTSRTVYAPSSTTWWCPWP